MGFGLDLLKGAAGTAMNTLTGGIAGGIGSFLGGLFGGNKKKAEQKAREAQYAHEKEMMGLQYDYNAKAAAQSQEYAKEMNALNYQQQNEFFDKTAEYNSAANQKKRLKEAGLNTALMYGLGGGQGGSTGGAGGGSGAAMQGVSNVGTQAVAMGLQAKMQESQIALNNASASKMRMEAAAIGNEGAKTVAETDRVKQETLKAFQETKNMEETLDLIRQQTKTEEQKTALTRMEISVKQLMGDEIVQSIAIGKANVEKITQETENMKMAYDKMIREIDGMDIDNSIKRAAKEDILKSYALDWQEKASRIVLNNASANLAEKKKEEVAQNITAIKHTITREDISAEEKNREIRARIEQILKETELRDQKEVREWLFGTIDAITGFIKR